jgi:hypothetical protein
VGSSVCVFAATGVDQSSGSAPSIHDEAGDGALEIEDGAWHPIAITPPMIIESF